MSRRPKPSGAHKVLTAVMIVIAVAVLLWLAVRLGGWLVGSDSSKDAANANSTGISEPSTSGATTSGSSAKGDSRQTTNPTPLQSTKVKITGAVKNENGTGAPRIAVLLYEGDDAKKLEHTDDEGKFEIAEAQIKPGASYSLQAKRAGLIGEATLISADVSGQKEVSKDITLSQPKTTKSEPTVMGFDDAQYKALADELGGMKSSLGSIQSSFTVFILMSMLIISVLMLTAYLLYRGDGHIMVIAERSLLISQLVDGLSALTEKLEATGRQDNLNQTLLRFPAQMTQTLQSLIDLQKHSGSARTDDDDAQQTEQRRRAAAYEIQTPDEGRERSSKKAARIKPQQKAIEWYQKLLRNGSVMPSPIYLQIDDSRSSANPLERRIVWFKETVNQSSFVLFRDNDDNAGWIFPNPVSNFAADHKDVYPYLTPENFPQSKQNADPIPVYNQDGCWRLAN
jgi:osmotically-inducible protein OsmY